MTLVIIAGEIDVSVGSQFAVASVIAGVLAKAGLPLIATAASPHWRAHSSAASTGTGDVVGCSVDRGDAGGDGVLARTAAVDYTGRMGTGLPRRFSGWA